MIRRRLKYLTRRDTESDKKRYDNVYSNLRDLDKNQLSNLVGLQTVDLIQRPLFIKYYSEIQKILINTELVVMELGAGFGRHTSVIADCGVKLIVNDISESALEINNLIHPNIFKLISSNMDDIPLPNQSIDVVISCGSLSYADPNKVNKEIFRLLKPGGHLIIIDTLNHNPIYKISRYMKVIIGARTLSSVLRIPKMKRIRELSMYFEESEISYFGKWLWLTAPVIKRILNLDMLNKKMDTYGPNFLAFKFLMVSKSYSPSERYTARK
jgi:ubiquinone/menaquinone biosynthesis C-methylase UbiE